MYSMLFHELAFFTAGNILGGFCPLFIQKSILADHVYIVSTNPRYDTTKCIHKLDNTQLKHQCQCYIFLISVCLTNKAVRNIFLVPERKIN